MPLIDLHTHTTASDGTSPPARLVEQACAIGIRLLAITDHDTVAGLEEASAAGGSLGVEIIRGIELSVNYEDGSLHLLGYGVDATHSEFVKALETLRWSRLERNDRILARLDELGYPLSVDDVRRHSGGGVLSRAHIARALMSKGYVKEYEEAFVKLLNRGAPAYVERERLSLGEAIELIHNAGGAAVWAHPGLHPRERMDAMLRRLPQWKAQGLDGIESDYSNHTWALACELRQATVSLGLVYTGGSDFHGEIKPHNQLGIGPEGRPLGEELVVQLKERIKLLRISTGGQVSAPVLTGTGRDTRPPIF